MKTRHNYFVCATSELPENEQERSNAVDICLEVVKEQMEKDGVAFYKGHTISENRLLVCFGNETDKPVSEEYIKSVNIKEQGENSSEHLEDYHIRATPKDMESLLVGLFHHKMDGEGNQVFEYNADGTMPDVLTSAHHFFERDFELLGFPKSVVVENRKRLIKQVDFIANQQ